MPEISLQTLDQFDPISLNTVLRDKYGGYHMPSGKRSFDNLQTISTMIAEVTGIKIFLIELRNELDIKTRLIDKKHPDHARYMSMKKVTESYIEIYDSIYNSLSRLITIYQLEQDELKSLGRDITNN